MTVKTAIAAAVISLTALVAVPAHATDVNVKIGFGAPGYGWGGYSYQPSWQSTLSPQQVRWILKTRGYQNISYFDRRGSVYMVRATQFGRPYFLVINAHNGRVMERNRI